MREPGIALVEVRCLGFLGTAEYSEGFNEGNETICGYGGVRTRDMDLLHCPQTLWRSIDDDPGNKIRVEESRPPPPLPHHLRPTLQLGRCMWRERGSFIQGILLQYKYSNCVTKVIFISGNTNTKQKKQGCLGSRAEKQKDLYSGELH